MTQLSPYRLGKACEVYNYFNVFNAVSWNLLSGSIITLLAMRLGASLTYIGIINAFFYGAFFVLPMARFLVRHFSVIKIYSFGWTVRAIVMLPGIAAPFADLAGNRDLALTLLFFGAMGFHFFRGIGMIGFNPILSVLTAGPDRGSYMTQIQIVNSAATMFGGFLMAMLLGREPPVFMYSILLSMGLITGIISGFLIRKVPEPPGEEEGKKIRLLAIFKEALAENSLRRFLMIFFLVAFVSGIARIFVVVYAREVFAQSEGMISLFTVFGGLGILMIGLCVKFVVDRIGAKPIFIVCVSIGAVCMIPIVLFPISAVHSMTGAVLFLVFLFFILNFGFFGAEGIAQTYFMALVPTQKMLDLGILYFLFFGVAGASGLFLTGLLLDMLTAIGLSPIISFRILFSLLIVLSVIAIILLKGLKPLGSLSLKGALEVIFSFRDLRAISLLGKLSKTQDSGEEEILLGALHASPSHLATRGLLDRARSPRLSTRLESIRALEKMPSLSEDAQKALMDDIANNPFTTAYISARILGRHGCKAAIPLLREMAASTDYMLAGEAITALAELKDEAFRPKIEQIILNTQNPRLKIMGAVALGKYHCADSLHILVEILLKADPPPYLTDEVVLAMSAILDTEREFYTILARYAADNSQTRTLAMDEVESAVEFCNASLGGKRKAKNDSQRAITSHAKKLHDAVSDYIQNKGGNGLSRWIHDLPEDVFPNLGKIRTILSETVLDNELCGQNCLRLLIVHWTAYQLRTWTNKIKENL